METSYYFVRIALTVFKAEPFPTILLSLQTSFLVASNGAKTADSYKGRTAQKQGVPIVGVSFIEKCVEEGRLLDKDDFLLVGTTANMQFGSGKITSEKHCSKLLS